MFVPLHDENSLKSIRFQYVTIGIIAVNVLVYLFEVAGIDDATIASFALIPRELFDTGLLPVDVGTTPAAPVVPERLTLLTYMLSLIHI